MSAFISKYKTGRNGVEYIIKDKMANETAQIQRLNYIIIIRIWHYENTPIQIYWKFYHQKIENF